MITKFTPFPTLTTERLILRRLVMRDIKELSTMRSDASVNQYLNRPKTTNIEEAEAYVHKIDGLINEDKSIYWVLCLKGDNELIGTACLWNFSPEGDIADIGYELRPEFQGKGLMNEAVEEVIRYAFDELRLRMILGVVHPENERSLNVLERNGFVKDEGFIYVSKEDAEGDVVYYLER